ncbi:MAG: MATE family efflux transporter [Bacteroidales bacterium]|jgi:putative MATE family efflux protein|nr:MATE family efflux transporter [Bacteroidales bacterium]
MKDFTVGKPLKEIFFFSLPILMGSAFQQLYNVVDSMVVGKFIGTEALAAVGASFPLTFLVVSLFIGIGTGFTVVVSQYFGAKKFAEIKRTLDTLILSTIAMTLILSVLGVISAKWILRWIGLEENIIPDATIYLQIYFGGIFFQFLFAGVNAVIRGLGDSKTPMNFLIISTALNVILDILFVVVFKWGVSGVGIATILAQIISLGVMLIVLNKKYPQFFDFSIRKFIFDKIIFKQAIKVGLPTGLQVGFVALGSIMIFLIVSPFGTNAIAAYSVVMRLDSFATLPVMNLATALSTFVGQNVGAGKYERVKMGLMDTLKISLAFSIVLSLTLIFLSDFLMTLFTDDAEVIQIGARSLHIIAPFYIIFAGMFTLQGCLRGVGAVMIPMFCTLISLWLVRIPLAWYLGKILALEGVWWSTPGSWFMGALLMGIYFASGHWKKVKVINN